MYTKKIFILILAIGIFLIALSFLSLVTNYVYADGNEGSTLKRIEEQSNKTMADQLKEIQEKEKMNNNELQDLKQDNKANEEQQPEIDTPTEDMSKLEFIEKRLLATARATGMKWLPITYGLSFICWLLAYLSENLKFFFKTSITMFFLSTLGLTIIIFAKPLVVAIATIVEKM